MAKLTATEVGKRLKEYRLAAKLSQTDIRKSSGLSKATISNMELGKHMPNSATVDAYLAAISRISNTELDRKVIFPELD